MHRLTSSCATLLMRATPAAWAQLARDLEAVRNWSDIPHENMPQAVRWGLTHEPEARWLFAEAHPDIVCHEKRFLHFVHSDSPLAPYVGTSPDLACYSGDDLVTVVEVKCPFSDSDTTARPAKYRAQIQWHLWVTGLPLCVFLRFDPRGPTYIETAWERDEPYIAQMQAKATRFLESYVIGEPLCA